MKLATTTSDFRMYYDSYEECLQQVCEAGFRYIDLSLYKPTPDDALLVREDWRECVKRLQEIAQRYGAKFVQAHSPCGNPLLYDEQYETLVQMTKRSLEACRELGIPNLVVHAGWRAGIGKETWFEENKAFYTKLFPEMERTGVNVLVENSTKANMGDMYHAISGQEMKEFVEYVNHPLLHICWDTGQANCEGVQYEHIMTMGKELYAVHINDNRGKQDEHLMPFMGTLNMDDVMHGLLDSGFGGYFTLECASGLRPSKYWLGDRYVFEADTRLSEPQLFMQKQMEKLMFEVGVYILKSYGVYEE